MKLDELGLMTFPEASTRWNKEATYVRQLYNAYPNKFLEGTTIKIGLGRGTYCITREGMEYLTGQTEEQASPKFLVRRERNNLIDFDKRVDSEDVAKAELLQLLANHPTINKNYSYTLDFIDAKKQLFGIVLPDMTKLYYRRDK